MTTYNLNSIIGTSLGVLSLIYISYYIKKRKRSQHPPKNAKWIFVGTVEEISLYPLKSGAAHFPNEVQCKIDGLYSSELKDRLLFLSDKNDKFIYAGVYPKMLSIKTEILDKNTLIIKAEDIESLTINLDSLIKKQPSIKYQQGCKLYLVEGDQIHHVWFSKLILNKLRGLKLYVNIKTEFLYNLLGEDKSDFAPVMVMNNKSINDLNQRLSSENQVHHLQFRGNVMIKAADHIKPYAEDHWIWLRFGEETDNAKDNCILHYHAPCLRCILVNVDVQTCIRNKHFEPLKTLKKYRIIHDKKEPTMGAYFKVYQEGSFKATDPVYAIIS
ncbi:mitochondrial amidoxime reducing component 2-like isoform 1-T2 [Cochliomyia hominivorax]